MQNKPYKSAYPTKTEAAVEVEVLAEPVVTELIEPEPLVEVQPDTLQVPKEWLKASINELHRHSLLSEVEARRLKEAVDLKA